MYIFTYLTIMSVFTPYINPTDWRIVTNPKDVEEKVPWLCWIGKTSVSNVDFMLMIETVTSSLYVRGP
jgi:hypothetical protein